MSQASGAAPMGQVHSKYKMALVIAADHTVSIATQMWIDAGCF